MAVAALFAFTVAFMLLLAGDGMEILYTVRAYTSAEGTWSKAQKSAVYFLNRYARSRKEADYQSYQNALAVPDSLREARIELDKPRPNMVKVRASLVRAGTQPRDVDGMINLYRRFRTISYTEGAMKAWTDADKLLLQMREKGEMVHHAVVSGASAEAVDAILADIDTLQTRVPEFEDSFNRRVGDGALWAKDIVKWVIAVSAVLLLTLGILTTWRLLSEASEANEKYRNLINTANDAIIISNRDTGRILEVNLKAEQLLNIPVNRLREMAFTDLLVSGAGWPENTGNQEISVRHADGHEVQVEASVNLTKVDGRVVVQSILRDMSDRKRLEAQLRQAAKMDAVGRLAGGIAHDFNNLLTVISGYGELAQAQLAPEDPLNASIEQILKAAERASSLTQKLLAFSRHHPMKAEVLDLNEVVTGVEMMLRRLIGENIEFAFLPESKLNCVKADLRQIEQVIVNLAVNARDAMPNGGKLTVRTRNLKITERQAAAHPFLKAGSYVSLALRDTGFGMDDKVKACIFEPFFTTKETGKGTGLGLAMVYGTVKQSGGFVLVNSELGKGTEFDILLPVVDGRPTSKTAQGIETASGTETVLVVEDQEDLRALLITVLQKNGYRVLDAMDGASALSKFQECHNQIALVITDVVMPGMGGLDLGTHLRKQVPGLKVLYMSGYTDSLMARQGPLSNDTPFLQKPFTPDVLARKVRDVLDGTTVRGA